MLYFWSHVPLQDMCDMLILSPDVMYKSHDICRKIWHMLISASLLSLEPVMM